jgi:hypothetical protein
MKFRKFLFGFFIFLVGLGVGYFVGQGSSSPKINQFLGKFAFTVEKQLVAIFRRGKAGPSKSPPLVRQSEESKTDDAAVSQNDKAAYIRSFILLSDIEAKPDKSGGGVFLISGKVTNSGDRTLKQVEISIYFLGKDTIVSESSFPAIRESILSPKESGSFSYKVERIPDGWMEGKIRASVTDIVF